MKNKNHEKDDVNITSNSICEYFNTFFEFESKELMFKRNKDGFLALNELLHWGYNESDIPEPPSKVFLESNQAHVLVPYLDRKDKKNGRQRSFDNLFYAISPDSFSRFKNTGVKIKVLGRLNNKSSVLNRYRPGLRWVKFGLYKFEDVSDDANYLNSIKQNAGLELMVFLYYYADIFKKLVLHFGSFPINGYDYIFGDNREISNKVAYIYGEPSKKSKNLVFMIGFREREKSKDENCLFLVDDYS